MQHLLLSGLQWVFAPTTASPLAHLHLHIYYIVLYFFHLLFTKCVSKSTPQLQVVNVFFEHQESQAAGGDCCI